MKLNPSSLVFHPDFRRFWAGDAVSQVGTAVTLVALPLVAITTLHASPFEAGLLVMFEYLAFLVIGLPAGAWVDRLRQRRVMIVCYLVRAVLFGSIPLAAYLGGLSLAQLYVVAFGASVCASFADVAAQSHLPRLVDGDQLMEANVKLEATRNIAQAGGPAAGGALIAALTAPMAIAVDAVSFGLSALLLSRVRRPEADPRRHDGATLRSEIAEGLRFVLGHRLLRAITVTAAMSNLCGTIGASMLLVLLAGQLHLSPFLCGLVFSAEAVGGLLGALAVGRIVGLLGQGPARARHAGQAIGATRGRFATRCVIPPPPADITCPTSARRRLPPCCPRRPYAKLPRVFSRLFDRHKREVRRAAEFRAMADRDPGPAGGPARRVGAARSPGGREPDGTHRGG